ncbi:hypothetical protein KIW84_011281 [Lathyrus oleraceus]|uniref:Uncharacterized protein n=1 Tax=Pisum sativum TaxID=3888 RepID=A0A9D4YN11_PEA|nr:hypothetical protein KIW84_011281 [Pisum sativum]
MITSAPNGFTEMVNMGMRLEEGVHEGSLSKDEASTSKKYGGSFSNKKEGETNAVSTGRKRTPHVRKSSQSIQHQHQGATGHDIKNCYPLKYEVPNLIKSGMVSFEDRALNVKANPLPPHGNASVNMVDDCPDEFKIYDVHNIKRPLVAMHKDICLFSDCEHDHDGCVICSVNLRGCVIVKRDIQRLMDEGLIQIFQSRHLGNDVNVIVLVFKTPEWVAIQFDSSNNSHVNRSVSPLEIRLTGHVPYSSDKDVSYQYNATMVENVQEVPLPDADSVVNIAGIAKVTRNGRVFNPVFPKAVEGVSVGKKAEILVVDLVSAPMSQSGESSKLKTNDDDKVLRLIKRSEFNVVEHLLQTPSKIYVLSLLMNSEAHREAL